MDDQIEMFEDALQKGFEAYLQCKGSLSNQKGEVFNVCKPCCRNLYLSLRDDYQKQLIERLIESPTNYHPCLMGYVNLTLKKENENATNKLYFYHICGDKSAVGGDADYEVIQTNDGIEINVKYVDYFLLQDGNRLW